MGQRLLPDTAWYILAVVVGSMGVVYLSLGLREPIDDNTTFLPSNEDLDLRPQYLPRPCPRGTDLAAPEVTWGCSCQGLSEVHGIKDPDRLSLQRAPEIAQTWWLKHRCKTRPAEVVAAKSTELTVRVDTAFDICKLLEGPAKLWPPPTLLLEGECHMLSYGNYLSTHWMSRLTAAAIGVRVRLTQCRLGNDPKNSASPFLRARGPLMVPALPPTVNATSICKGTCAKNWAYPHECKVSELLHMAPVIRHDLQTIAAGFAATLPANESLIGVGGDDVAIHLRVGDVLNPRITQYGLTPWWYITQALDGTTPARIGIVTIAGQTRMRYEDVEYANTSTAILNDLVHTLEATYPQAVVRVHNGKAEHPTAAISRLVLATEHTVCTGISTFCLWAVMASSGVGHVPYTPRMYPWIANVNAPNVVATEPPILSGTAAKGWDARRIIEWLHQPAPK
jgi:hypothetical protein